MRNSTAGTRSSDQYFAMIEDPVDLASAMQNKIRVWRDWASSRGLMDLWQKKLANYYGNSMGGNSSQRVSRGGSEGELSLIKVNDLHRLVQEQLVMVTSQRPAGQARAINSDSASLKSARIGTALSEYYLSEVGLEQKFVNTAERALIVDEGYSELFWDKTAGDKIGVDLETGLPEMSGDIVFRIHSPWNVARDPGLTTEQHRWYILSFPVNRFDAAATYPKFAQQILSVKDDSLPSVIMNNLPDDTDAIFIHLLVHDRTPACPEGRYALMIGDNVVMDDAEGLPYPEFPVGRITASDVIDGTTGYAPSNDILALEEMTDGLHSIISSNQITFGGQSIVGPQGANLKVSDLAKGLRYFELPPDLVDKLRPLQLTQTPPEVFNYIGMLGQKKEAAIGSVASSLAQQASQGASGSSMALIQSQAISYNSGIQRSYFRLLSTMMTKLIRILSKYADTERVVKIVGKSKSSGLKEFKYTGRDLNSISSITFEIVNPLSQTVGGKLQMAQDLLNAGQIKSPKQYLLVATTGQLDAMIEDDEADQILLIEEKEMLGDGQPVQAIITEFHADHIKSHMSVLSDPKVKSDPNIVNATLGHIFEHLNLWQQASMTNPGILMATGQQPLMPPPPQMMGGQLPPPGGGASQDMGQIVGNGQSPAETQAEEVQQPNLPNIAGTDQKPTIPGVTDAGM